MPENGRTRTIASKPLTPTLSSNLRTRPAHGVTPRLAGAAITSPPATTSLQRSLRQQTLSPDRNTEEGVASLNANITPRSGARISRFDIDSPSTPDTTTRSRSSEFDANEEVQNVNHGLGISSPVHTPTQPRGKPNEHLSYLPMASNRRISGGSNVSSAKEESKFFRADDVKSPSTRPAVTRARTTYSTSVLSPRISPQKTTTQDTDKPAKFFHASSLLDQQKERSMRPTLAMKLSAASVASQSTRSLPALRSSTDSKASIEADSAGVTSDIHPASFVAAPVTSRVRSTSNTASGTGSVLERRRSSSLNIQPVVAVADKGHRKSLSATSTIMEDGQLDQSVNERHSVPDSSISQKVGKTSILTTALPSVVPATRTASSGSTSSQIQTATTEPSLALTQPNGMQMRPRHLRGSSEATAIQPITKAQIEAAASARRERKVLDLEISNSSLLAINRTLEKELRKQNAELRRFRRLSRSGRLSLAPSNRIISIASVSTLGTLDEGDRDSTLCSMSPTSSDLGSIDDDDIISDDDEGSSLTESSDAIRKRARDEKRLMQDLQRHQQILLDSQKLTQSIQRCLNMTDELIRDGNKALAYQVDDHDLQIGGKVLTHDDDEALSEVDFDEYKETMIGPRQGLLSPTITKDALEEAAMWANGIQALDGNSEAQIQGPVLAQPMNESPSPTIGLSPVLLPQR